MFLPTIINKSNGEIDKIPQHIIVMTHPKMNLPPPSTYAINLELTSVVIGIFVVWFWLHRQKWLINFWHDFFYPLEIRQASHGRKRTISLIFLHKQRT